MPEDHSQLMSNEDVAQLLEVAWLAFYDSPLARVAPDDIERPDMVYASVSIGGPKDVAIHLHCTPTLARKFTAAVMGSDYRDSNEDDVSDVLGELANVIGGNYKGAIGEFGAWTLSLPVVAHTEEELPRVRVTAQVSFLCEGELIGCHVLERDERSPLPSGSQGSRR